MEADQQDKVDKQSQESHNSSDEEDLQAKIDKPIIAQMYVSEHVEQTLKEIEMLKIKSKPLRKMQFIKKRKYFGQNYKKFHESDANDHSQEFKMASDLLLQNIPKKVIDIGLQNGNPLNVSKTQTVWNRKINKGIIVQPEDQIAETEDDDQNLINFLNVVYPRMEEALQANETIDIFQDDFDVLPEDDLVGADTELTNTIKEIKSLNYNSQKKKVSCIQFQPRGQNYDRKIVANSFIEGNLDFDERCQLAVKSYKSEIQFWDFEDIHSIEPILILQSPLEVICFAFNPKDPNIIVGGAVNGQIILWDLKDFTSAPKPGIKIQQQKTKQEKSQIQRLDPLLKSALQDPSSATAQTQEITKRNVNSHRNAVMCLRWLPSTIEIDRKNLSNLLLNTGGVHYQFASISDDGQVLIWDLRSIFPDKKGQQDKKQVDLAHLQWRSIFGIQLFRPEGGGQLGGHQLAFQKGQKTSTFAGTSDEGELFLVDWALKTTEDGSKADMVYKIWQNERNYRPALLDRSPFFSDIYLTLHDFHFCIWQTDIDQPIFQSLILKDAQITCGAFSPFRPGVIFIGRTDGFIDIWDFADISHKQAQQHRVVSESLSYLKFHEHYAQYFAVGDVDGNLHMLELPYTLCKKIGDEEQLMRNFWEREVERVKYYKKRFQVRKDQEEEEAQEKEKQEAMKQQKQFQKPTSTSLEGEQQLTEDDILEKEYQLFAEQYIAEFIEKQEKAPEEEEEKKQQKLKI